MAEKVWVTVMHEPAGDALHRYGGIGEPGMWVCRVEGPHADTGEFRMDEPADVFDAAPADVLQRICRHNEQATAILGEALRDGSAIYMREYDENRPEVIGFELPQAELVGPAP